MVILDINDNIPGHAREQEMIADDNNRTDLIHEGMITVMINDIK